MTLEQITRLKGLIAASDEMAQRFAGYHQTAVANGDDSIWDVREKEERGSADALRSLLAAIPVWHPIPTEVDTGKAPFDGKQYQIWRESTCAQDSVFIVEWDAEDGLWQCNDGKHYTHLRGQYPTHYQPLPTPPTGEGE